MRCNKSPINGRRVITSHDLLKTGSFIPLANMCLIILMRYSDRPLPGHRAGA